jgi:parvulin-like peptidyl-prolyl isomerase
VFKTILLLSLVPAVSGAVLAQEAPPKPGVVAILNGKELTEAEFLRRCERAVGGRADTAVGYGVLRDWLEQSIAEEEATRRNLLPTKEAIDRRLLAVRKQFELRGEDFDDWLARHGRSAFTMREDIRQQLVAENLLTDGISVPDAEVALYYEGNKAVFAVPAQLRVSRITTRNKDRARELDAAVKQGRPFEELARKYSEDPYQRAGGKIATPVDADPKAQGPIEKEVLEKLLRLEPGKIVGPIKLEEYWVFARLDERLPARIPALTDVQDLLTANLKVQKAGPERLKAAQDRLDQLQREAKVQIFRPEYQRLLRAFKRED